MPEVVAPAVEPAARALLDRAARAHGLDAFTATRDVAVSYAGRWPPLIAQLQPTLVDRGHRERSEERLIPGLGLVAQAHRGPEGGKHVLRRRGAPGEVRVRFDGVESADPERRAAAALVADGYALFLLGPLLLATAAPGAAPVAAMERAGSEDITVGERRHACDVLRARLAPGLGLAPSDRLALWIDRDEGLMRRVRFTLDGLASTRGAVAEVDAWDHVTLGGVRWPTRFHERLLRPLALPVHDWWVTGLDLDRGMTPDDLGADGFRGRAAPPASPLARPGIG